MGAGFVRRATGSWPTLEESAPQSSGLSKFQHATSPERYCPPPKASVPAETAVAPVHPPAPVSASVEEPAFTSDPPLMRPAKTFVAAEPPTVSVWPASSAMPPSTPSPEIEESSWSAWNRNQPPPGIEAEAAASTPSGAAAVPNTISPIQGESRPVNGIAPTWSLLRNSCTAPQLIENVPSPARVP